MSSELERLQERILHLERINALAGVQVDIERKGREEEQRKREEQQRRHEEQTGKSTLPQFLDACHTQLYLGLAVRKEKTESTQGHPANADNKVRPDHILPWLDFAAHQTKVWDVLMNSDFVFEKHFTSLNWLEESGEQLRTRQVSSEMDLHHFARLAVEDPVASIIKCLAHDPRVRDKLGLQGLVSFENHGNMLRPDPVLQSLQDLSLSNGQPRRRSPRFQAPATQTDSSAKVARSSSPIVPNSSRSRPDQFCIYSVTGESGAVHRVPATTAEYKAPHKLTLGHIYAGLTAMNVAEIVKEGLEEDVTRRCQRLMAAIITQEFASMIKSGLEYGYIFTGPALILLRVPKEDPSSVYFSLAVPLEDVGETTGCTPHLDQPNRLHLTAVGQLLAFTLRATQSPPRDCKWRRDAENRLSTWKVIVEEQEDSVLEEEVCSSEYRPPTGDSSDFRLQSPISRRLRRPMLKLQDQVHHLPGSSSSSGDEDDMATPSRANSLRPHFNPGGSPRSRPLPQNRIQKKSEDDNPRRQRNLGPYCSPSCLKGLVEGSALDTTCPNAQHHGEGQHAIDFKEFQRLIRKVLCDQLDYCEELYINGAVGFLYQIRLPAWGYTVVAKGTRPEHLSALNHEAMIYRHLKSLQGIHIPMYLGTFKLKLPLWYMGFVPIEHMMLMSFGGYSLNHLHCPASIPADQAVMGLQAIHACGILQRDMAPRNVLYDPRRKCITWHDFGRATTCARPVFGELSTNVGLSSSAGQKKRKYGEADFARELKKARAMFHEVR